MCWVSEIMHCIFHCQMCELGCAFNTVFDFVFERGTGTKAGQKVCICFLLSGFI